MVIACLFIFAAVACVLVVIGVIVSLLFFLLTGRFLALVIELAVVVPIFLAAHMAFRKWGTVIEEQQDAESF